MHSLIRVGLFFSAVGCLLSEGATKLETYRNLLTQAEPYPIAAPPEPQRPGRRPRFMYPENNRGALQDYEWRVEDHRKWRQQLMAWEEEQAKHHGAELNRLVASTGSYVQMLNDLGLRQTLTLLQEARYFMRPHPEAFPSTPAYLEVFQSAVREFGRTTRTMGYAVEGISAARDAVKPHLALLPFMEGLLAGKPQILEENLAIPDLSDAFLASAKTLPGTGLKFGEKMLLGAPNPSAFLFLLSIERSQAGSAWPRIVAKEFNENNVFKHFLDLSPTEEQWAEMLRLWPAKQALASLEANRIWVGWRSRLRLRLRSCADFLSAPR